MKERSADPKSAVSLDVAGDTRALEVRDTNGSAAAWWTGPGIDGLGIMCIMLDMNRLFVNSLIALVGTQLTCDSVFRHAVFATRWRVLE